MGACASRRTDRWRLGARALVEAARRPLGRVRLLEVFEALGRSPGRAGAPIGWLAVALCLRIGAAALVALAFGLAAPLTAALVLLPAAEIASLLPLTPGNLGLTSAAVAVALHTTGTSAGQALAVGIGFHAAEMAAGITFGLASSIYLLGARTSIDRPLAVSPVASG